MKYLKTNLLSLQGSVRSSGSLVVRKIPNDGTETTRVADSQGRSSTTDLTSDGLILNRVEGRASYGEADNLVPCKILIERLNRDGEHWLTPFARKGEEDGTDCVASNGKQELRMQVTRIPRQKTRRELSIFGSAQETTTIENHVADLRQAIKKKETLSTEQRKSIILVIDAVDFPSYAYSSVVEAFQKKYLKETQNLRFHSIWLIGPTPEMTVQLDIT